jgi:hypothetical protein
VARVPSAAALCETFEVNLMPKNKPKTKIKTKRKAAPRAPRKVERFRLYAKPGRPAPPWWPRKHGRPVWVGVDGDGWALGPGPAMTRAELRYAKLAATDPDGGFIPGKNPRLRIVCMGVS